MKPKTILFVLGLSGGLCGCPSLAVANLGESLRQINARYGKPVHKLPDSMVNDPAVSIYRYEFNGRRIFVEFMQGKSVSETIRAPQASPHFSEKVCLAMAAQISGKTNWTEMTRSAQSIVWVAGDTTATLNLNPTTPDYFFVSSMKYNVHEMQLGQDTPAPLIRTNETKVHIKGPSQADTNAARRSVENTNSVLR